MNIFLIGIIVFVILVILWVIMLYNGMIRSQVRIKETWANVDVQLKKRISLIPNLVETVKGYAKHEKSVFEEVARVRSMALSARTPEDKMKTNNMLTDTLKSLFAVSENYPQLKASENFQSLQETLSMVENAIAKAREQYNSVVLAYNTMIQTFPGLLMARMMHCASEPFFEAASQDKKEVTVSF